MTTQTELKTLTALRSIPLTSHLETQHLKVIAAVTSEQKFLTDEIIYKEGEEGTALYIIQEGEVVIEIPALNNTWISILTLGPGELFGWSSLFPTERKKARARATKPTYLLAIDAARLRAAWQTDQNLEYAIVDLTSKVLIDRIKIARQQLVAALRP